MAGLMDGYRQTHIMKGKMNGHTYQKKAVILAHLYTCVGKLATVLATKYQGVDTLDFTKKFSIVM